MMQDCFIGYKSGSKADEVATCQQEQRYCTFQLWHGYVITDDEDKLQEST